MGVDRCQNYLLTFCPRNRRIGSKRFSRLSVDLESDQSFHRIHIVLDWLLQSGRYNRTDVLANYALYLRSPISCLHSLYLPISFVATYYLDVHTIVYCFVTI
jgi:hypothetical protein